MVGPNGGTSLDLDTEMLETHRECGTMAESGRGTLIMGVTDKLTNERQQAT